MYSERARHRQPASRESSLGSTGHRSSMIGVHGIRMAPGPRWRSARGARPRRGRRRAGTGPAPSARSRPGPAAPAPPRRGRGRRRRPATPCSPGRPCGRPRSADSVGPRPIEPVIPLSTTSAGRAASSSAARGPARISGSAYSPLRPAALRRRGVEGQLEVLRGGGPGDGDRADAEGERLLGQPCDVASPGGQAGDPQPVRVLLAPPRWPAGRSSRSSPGR